MPKVVSPGNAEIEAAIRACLGEVKADAAYMRGGPSADELHQLKALHEGTLESFWSYVAKTLSPTKKPKRIQRMRKVLEENMKEWRQLLVNFEPSAKKTASTTTTTTKKSSGPKMIDGDSAAPVDVTDPSSADASVAVDQQSLLPASSQRNGKKRKLSEIPKKKKKKRASAATTADNNNNNNNNNNVDDAGNVFVPETDELTLKERQLFAAESKAKFEEEKAEILDTLSGSYKAKFGQLAFCNWNKMWRPVILLSPFDVAPNSQMRKDWKKMHHNTRSRPTNRWHIAYWYGSPEESAFTYTMISKVVMWEAGVRKGYDRPPPSIQRKLDANKPLTKSDQEHLRGLELAKQALEMPLEQRRRPLCFEEEHELLMSFHGKINLKGETNDTDDSSADKGNSQRQDDDDDDDHDQSEEFKADATALPPKKKKTKKVIPSSTNKNKVPKPIEAPKENKPAAKNHIDEMDFAEMEEDSNDNGDDSDDGSDEEEELQQDDEDDDDDEKDADFVDDEITPKTKKQTKKTTTPKKKKENTPAGTPPDGDKEKKETKKRKLDRTRKTPPASKKVKKADSELTPAEKASKLKREAQKAFEKCEEQILPCVRRLKEAVDKKAITEVEECLDEIREKHASIVTGSFLSTYKVVNTLKECKALLGKESVHFQSAYQAVKTVYESKRKSELVGFQPVTLAEREQRKAARAKAKVNREAKLEREVNQERQVESAKAKNEEQTKVKTEQPTKGKVDSSREPKVSKRQSSVSVKGEELSVDIADKIPRASSTGSLPVKPKPSPKRTISDSRPQITQKTPSKSRMSLKNLLSGSKTSKPKAAPTETVKRSVSTSSKEAKPKVVTIKWLKEVVEDETLKMSEDRQFALEVLLEACEVFPSDKVVLGAVASALESAVYSWSKSAVPRHPKASPYWTKVHAIVAALVGVRTKGKLVDGILAGRFPAPDKVAALSDNELSKMYMDE